MRRIEGNQDPIQRIGYTGRRYLTSQEAAPYFKAMHGAADDSEEGKSFKIRNQGLVPPPDMGKVMIGRSSLPPGDRD